MPPVLGGEVVERGQLLPVLVELGERLGVLRAELLPEGLQLALGVPARWRFDDLVQQLLGPRLQALGQAVEHVGGLVNPTPLLACFGEHVAQRRPRSERAVADDELGAVQPAALHVAEHARPRVARLAVAVLHGEQLLLAVLAHADHHEQAQLVVLAQAHRHVHPVDEQVGVAAEAEVPL